MSAFIENLPVKVLGCRGSSVWGPRYPPPLCYTLYEYMFPCTVLFHTGKGGMSVRGALVHKRGRKYQHDWLYLQSVKLNKTPVKTTFMVWCLYRYLVHGLMQEANSVYQKQLLRRKKGSGCNKKVLKVKLSHKGRIWTLLSNQGCQSHPSAPSM